MKFSNVMLFGGAKSIQKTVYDIFISHPSSEKFFRKMNDLILREISRIDRSAIIDNTENDKARSKFAFRIMRLLQLLCECHNLDMQNYLRQQTNSKNNYDLISLSSKMVCSYKINSNNFATVSQGLEALTEFIQV